MFTYYPGENLSPPAAPSRAQRALAEDTGVWEPVVGPLVIAEPFDACSPVDPEGYLIGSQQMHADLVEPNPHEKEEIGNLPRASLSGAIVMVRRGACMFMEKAKNVIAVRIFVMCFTFIFGNRYLYDSGW